MFGGFETQVWCNPGCGTEDVVGDVSLDELDSDSSEYQRELEVALYSQIHHDAVEDVNTFETNSFCVESAVERNGEIVGCDSESKEKSAIIEGHGISPSAASTPFMEIQNRKKKRKSKSKTEIEDETDCSPPKIKDFLTTDCEIMSPPSKPVKSSKKKNSTPQVITFSSDVTTDTDVIVEKHIKDGVSIPVKKKKNTGKCSEDSVVDLTLFDKSNSSSSESDILLEITDVDNQDSIVLNVDNKGGRKIVLDAAELSDYEELCKLDQDASWKIIDSDKYSGTGYTESLGRYYGVPKFRCHNCDEKGHLSKDCTKPRKIIVCFLCGLEGHGARTCPNNICHNCYQPGHSFKECTERRVSHHNQCHRCSGWGHLRMGCSDHWRQYHLTTKPGRLVQKGNEENARMYCFNCGAEGHFGNECNEEMMNRWSKVPYCPWISHYDHHIKIRETKQTESKKRPAEYERGTEEPPGKRAKRYPPSGSDSQVSHHTKDWLSRKGPKDALKKTTKKGKKKKFEAQYGGEDLPRSSGHDKSFVRNKKRVKVDYSEHSWLLDEPKKKKKGNKNFKEKKAALAAKAFEDDSFDGRGRKKGKASWGGKGTGQNFKSKWVPSEQGNWTYKGKGKKRVENNEGHKKKRQSRAKFFKSKNGFNSSIF